MVEMNSLRLDPQEQHFRIDLPGANASLFLRFLPARRRAGGPRKIVLYVHGGTFPSALSIAHRFDGYAWRDALCDAGFDVWGFDFRGFGLSDRYPQMQEPAEAHPPLCRTEDAARQLEAAIRFILERHGVPRLSLIAHSWGSMPACRAAGEHPALIDRIVLFGPIARRVPSQDAELPTAPAWRVVTLEDQWKRFVEDVPAAEAGVLSPVHFADWGERYLDSDPESRSRTPAGVKIPAGPFTDIAHAWQGELAYEPSLVRAPVALIRGEWDSLFTDEDARWLFDALKSAPMKRDIKISLGTHLMHLEVMRHALYRESIAFLLGGDEAPLQQRNL